MDVNKETINQLARLARLNLDEAEKEGLVQDLKRILDFVDELKEENTEGIEPLIFLSENSSQRNDIAHNELSNEEALRNASEKGNGFFKVPKVIK